MKLMKNIKLWLALIAMTGGYAMFYLDSSIVSVSLPTIQKSLHASNTSAHWFINAYLLPLAMFLITGGRLGDFFGLKLIYVLGLSSFTIASFFCGMATSSEQLIIARFIQGISAALMHPMGQAVIYHIFPKEKRGQALGYYGGIAVVFLAAGPFIGGVLTEYISWRWIFWVNIPIAAIVLTLTFMFVPNIPKSKQRKSFDFVGQCALYVMFAALVYGIMELNWKMGIVFLVTLPLLILWEKRVKNPFLPLKLFKNSNFVSATINFFCAGFVWISLVFISLYLQLSLKYSPSFAGSIMLLMMIPQVFLNPVAGKAADRFGSKRLLQIGMGLLIFGMVWLFFLSDKENFTYLIPGLLAFFLALPLIYVPNFRLAMHSVSATNQGAGSGIGSAARGIGSTIGMALIGLISTFYSLYADAFAYGMLLNGVIGLIGFFFTALLVKNTKKGTLPR